METFNRKITWRSRIPALVEVAARGDSPVARQVALDELYRLADYADRLIAVIEPMVTKKGSKNQQ